MLEEGKTGRKEGNLEGKARVEANGREGKGGFGRTGSSFGVQVGYFHTMGKWVQAYMVILVLLLISALSV